MQPLDLEPEMEELLLRLFPNLASQWQGATEDEINQIEQIAGCTLPRFYRWFLMRMGHSMGPIAYATMDFSASKVLSCYAEELFVPHPRFLMIGYESDDIMPLHLLYDFDYPARDDALVTKLLALGGPASNQFETFREKIAWGALLTHVYEFPERCRGLLVDPGGDVLSQLDSVMSSLGFKTPIQTGPYCGLYEGSHAAMVTHCEPEDPPQIHPFHLGGSDTNSLRRFLGEIAAETSLEIEIRKNDPRRLHES